MSKKKFLLTILLALLITTTFMMNVLAWSNAGYSADPSTPNYGTHDWIAQHALDWLPDEEKQYLTNNLATYLYGTELPDNGEAPDGIGDTAKHHIYYNSGGVMTDDSSAVRASKEYNNTLSFLRAEELTKAAKNAGIMSHYIVDMAVFGHVMGADTDWGAEQHHSDYETYINQRTSNYDSELNYFLNFDGSLTTISAYDAAKNLAYDTTFDVDGDLTCVWMDQNYDWSNPLFWNRCGESLNLAVNYLTDVLHTLYLESTMPIYIGIAQYYDNRKAVVTISMDDLAYNDTYWDQAISMMIQKSLYHTVGIITNASWSTDWAYTQYWINQGYTEAGSHSRNHVHTPYTGIEPGGTQKVSYEWQINGSKNDIIGNLTLPNWWRYGNKEFVYAWIEPYGSSDSTVREWLGKTFYLCDRRTGSGAKSWATWDSTNHLFNKVGYSIEMGASQWGGKTSAPELNSIFDSIYNTSGIYHLICHPAHVNWNLGEYADAHTNYIQGRLDVWYVSFGLLYLYRWVATQNVVQVTSMGSEPNRIFKINMSSTDHSHYGACYPVTYFFDIPSSWESVYVYYRYLETDPWMLMANKSSEEFFNGVDASRFDFTHHKAYVSVGFSDKSDEIYLQLCSSPIDIIPPVADAGPDQTVNEDAIVTFNGSNSWDDNAITNYAWTFFDGTLQTLTGPNPNYNFTTPGTYYVVLTVTDSGGNQATDTVIIIVLDVTKPMADAGSTLIVEVGSTLVFNASGSTDNGGIIIYRWDFGDETNGTGVTTTHVYGNIGIYVATLTVWDAADNSDTATVTVIVFPPTILMTGVAVAVGIVLVVTLFWTSRRSKT